MIFVIIIELVLSILIIIGLYRKDDSIFKIEFEESPSFYFTMFLISFISYFYLKNAYREFPYSIPKSAVAMIDMELSFASSIIYGVNSQRNDFIIFKNPLNSNSNFEQTTLPMFFLSGCISSNNMSPNIFKVAYTDILFHIYFLNILSTGIFLYYFATIHNLNGFFGTLFVLATFLNSGWAFFRYIFYSNANNNLDFYQSIGFLVPLPLFHFFAQHLCFSLTSSISIPLTILSLCFNEDSESDICTIRIFGGFLSSLIPDFFSSFGSFAISLCYKNDIQLVIPFTLSLIPKMLSLDLCVMPLWREFQNEGYYYSQVLIWFELLGPMFFSLLFLLVIPFLKKVLTFNSDFEENEFFFDFCLPRFAVFILLNFIREENGFFSNSLAINGIFIPLCSLIFTQMLYNFYHEILLKEKKRYPTLKGSILALSSFIYLSFIVGGLIFLKNILNSQMYLNSSKINITDKYKCDNMLQNFIMQNTTNDDIFFGYPIILNPISFYSGKQLFMGDIETVWKYSLTTSDISKVLTTLKKYKNKLNPMYLIENNNISYIFSTNDDSIIKNLKKSFYNIIFQNKCWSLYKIVK